MSAASHAPPVGRRPTSPYVETAQAEFAVHAVTTGSMSAVARA